MEDLDRAIRTVQYEIECEQKGIKPYCIYFEEKLEEFPNELYLKHLQNKLEQLLKLKEIAIKNNLVSSKSPYSESLYLHKENEKIDWHSKPENSYRLSDHWNFGDHCHTADKVEDGEFRIMIYKNGLYYNI